MIDVSHKVIYKGRMRFFKTPIAIIGAFLTTVLQFSDVLPKDLDRHIREAQSERSQPNEEGIFGNRENSSDRVKEKSK